MKIPDDDMVGWISTLREGRLSQRMINKILAHLNDTYADALESSEARSLDPLRRAGEYYRISRQRELMAEERQDLESIIDELARGDEKQS